MAANKGSLPTLRPADAPALEASEGRRRKRKRDQIPDPIGLSVKRSLRVRAVQDDPNPEAFEEWRGPKTPMTRS